MNGNFSFAFIESKNLGLKFFPVQQAEVGFDITGYDDPLTLQQMRDEVSEEFKKTQKQVNDFIKSRAGEIEHLGFNERKQKHEKLLTGGNVTIARFLADFKKTSGDKLDAFLKEQKSKQDKAAAASAGNFALKWTATFVWKAYEASKAIQDLFGADSPLKMYDAIVGFHEALQEIAKLLQQLKNQFDDEKTVADRLQKSLKAMKGKGKVSQADAKAAKDLVDLYAAKVASLELTAKSLSSKIAVAVAAKPDSMITPADAKKAETELNDKLKGLVDLQKAVKSAQGKLQKFRLGAGAAAANAKKGGEMSWAEWLGAKYSEVKEASAWGGEFEEVAKEMADKEFGKLVERFGNPENVVRKL